MKKKTVLAALGGNAILQPKQAATFENQMKNVIESCKFLADLVAKGYRLVITHGNGPQVGNILRQNEEAKDVIPPMSLDVCSAESQGFIGYMIQQALRNELEKIGLEIPVASLVTRVEVSIDDAAFHDPSKPIGGFYTEQEAAKLMIEKNWLVKPDANRGWRRVVPSPKPVRILESDSIMKLLDNGHIVIACGGGGIPVVKDKDGDGVYRGVEAVIDKDLSGCKLAEQIGADLFVILTDVEHVFINYGKENQMALQSVSVGQLAEYVQQGQFSKGSMGPKIEAAISFAKTGGKSIICALEKAAFALQGKSGTVVHSGLAANHQPDVNKGKLIV
ncbi:carbamate kinase [Fodinisporobacter ferrooxydans]|uniref:Carbamate kinase n=1 Tax=Fodinisporobacter ferrooxydans TaxID=2901836 RepID=A0ABY4CWT9_9BACL|nr:carbamate kinase [Alicyclobacillaceae bacterium MYW30-H2]